LLQRAAHNQGQVSEEDDYEVIGEHRLKEEPPQCPVQEEQVKEKELVKVENLPEDCIEL